ncbi:unnamed protein product [marine sediment metagenome]|uniref:Uncharacterized protein n=1 Tax=marine sediment metagenome TaxID=412755 RepID=X1MQN0_9ZZZZ
MLDVALYLNRWGFKLDSEYDWRFWAVVVAPKPSVVIIFFVTGIIEVAEYHGYGVTLLPVGVLDDLL